MNPGVFSWRVEQLIFVQAFGSLLRHLTQNRTPAYHTALARGIVLGGTMHYTAVVPDDELPRNPAVLIGEIRMHRQLVQLVDQRPTLSVVHAQHMFGMIA